MKIIFVISDMSWLYDYKSQFPLGILYLSGVLKKEGWEVEIFDSNINSIEDISEADVYGFSVVYNTCSNSIYLAQSIHRKFKDSYLIVGGVEPTLESSRFINCFNSIFVGEAEDTIKEFSDDFKKCSTKKYYYQSKIVDISGVFPDRSILSDSYIRTDSIFTGEVSYCKGGATSILFSRGCPSNCIFCCSPKLYKKKVRFRSISSIESEIKQIIEIYGIRQFRIQDDTFTLNLSFLRKVTECLKNLNIFYRCSTRADKITDEVVELLFESGCKEIGLGVEVADNKVLEILKKNVTTEQITEAIRIIRKHSITIRCFFMIGYPFDTEELMHKNIDFIENNKLENVVCCNLIPFPGTELYDRKEDFGITEIKSDCCMNLASHIKLTPNFKCNSLTEEEHISIMQIFYDYLLRKGFIR